MRSKTMTGPPPVLAQLLRTAVAHHQAGRLAEADALYGQALRADPDNPDALHLSGLIAYQRGDSVRAVKLIAKALKRGDGPSFRHNFALALDAAGRAAEARAAYQRALALEERAAAHNNLASLLVQQGARADAMAHYRRAIALDPSFTEAHVNLGSLLRDEDRPADAEPHLRRAVALDPRHAAAWRTLGLVLEDLGRPVDALACYDRALTATPGDADTLNNLGNAQKELGRFGEAIASYTRALDAAPGNVSARVNRALARLTLGDFAGGWQDYVHRTPAAPENPAVLTRDALPDVAGRRVLLFHDQGIGDELFFLRFAPELKRRGAWLAYCAGAQTASLCDRLAFLDAVAGRDAPAADLQLSISDLPFLLGHRDAAAIPESVRIPPLPAQTAAMQARLAATGPAPYVAVTWRAGIQRRNSLSKIVPLGGVAAALKATGATVVVLQRKPAAGELDQLGSLIGRPAHDFTALNDDLESMLALLALVDDYVAVSNTNVHLRAAAGRTSRVLVPFPPDYRWMADGASPWFPNTPIYREAAGAAWDASLARLAADLSAAFPA